MTHSHASHSHASHSHASHSHGAVPHGAVPNDAELAPLLDLDAEVLHAYYAELSDWLTGHAAELPGLTVRRAVDLGAGTGTGTFGLLRQFPEAEVTAVDGSAELLGRLARRAQQLGLAHRVSTVEADLDGSWPELGEPDLIWASASLHHLADPGRGLRQAFAALRPGGLLAVVELSGFPRFLPDDIGLGTPGLEARCDAALAEQHAEGLPHLGADWGPQLTEAGFTLTAERHFTIGLSQPLPEATGRYAQARMLRLRSALDGRLGADDLAVLDRLADEHDPQGVLHRTDLTVRTDRWAWLARRPLDS
ncbi:class I SAM-dependent methyltransferase [Kitasatospora sp. McL0602]|uniref:class I SAM-dependent methyltransferase n=1 Tax=Kitasatospora sp. McL0602 TaxID=3439530 RepID=UPI003F8973E2